MTRRRFRWVGVGLLAGGLGAMSTLNAASAIAADDTALIMGFAGQPNPGQSYFDEVMNLFIDPQSPFPGQPVFSDYNPVIQLVPLNNDYGQGTIDAAAELHQGIMQHLEDGKVVVFGYSESTSVATQEMITLANLPADQRPDPDDLNFVLVENLNNPNGGVFERLPFLLGQSLPATPADTPYPTDIYTLEYSEMADFPKYPLNPFAMGNAIASYVYQHPFLIPGWPTTFDPSALQDAVLMSTLHDGATDYWMIPTQDLPLLAGLRSTPFVGQAMADLIQPSLRVLVDLGYDRTDPADVVTSAQLFSPTIDWDTVAHNLELGVQQGWTAFQVDMGMLDPSHLPDLYPYLPDLSGLIAGSTVTGLLADPVAAEVPMFGALFADLTTLFTNPLEFFSL